MTIREAMLDDAPRIADVVIACWRYAYRGVLPDAVLDRDTRDERTTRIRRRIEDGWPTFVADTGQIVGMVRIGGTAPHGYDAEIEGLYVHPDAGRGGVGRALVREACDYFATYGKRTLYIHTMRDNRIGRAFYVKLGGRIVVEDTWTYEGVAYPAVGYLWDDLRTLRD